MTNNRTGSATGLFLDAANGNFSPVEGSALIDGGAQIAGFSSGRFCGSQPDQGSREQPIPLSAVVEHATPTVYSLSFCLPTQSVRGGVGLQTPTVSHWAILIAGSDSGSDLAITDSLASNKIAFVNDAPGLVDQAAVSALLSGLTCPHVTFVAGGVVAKQNTQLVVDLSQDGCTTILLVLQARSDASGSYTIKPKLPRAPISAME